MTRLFDLTGKAPARDRAGAERARRPSRLARARGFRASVTLKTGETIVIRDARRTDRRLIEEGLRQLSTRSRFVQYLGANLRLSKGDLDQLTDTDNHDDVAIGAVARNRPGGRSVPLGVARFIRPVPGGRAAEIAITVVDTYQGKGCGTALLAALARKADACGVEAFFALVHPENAAMRALAERAGGTVSTSGTETEYRINVSRVINEMKPASET